MNRTFLVMLLISTLIAGCDAGRETEPAAESRAEPAKTPAPPPKAAEIRELDWDALIPADWQPETLMNSYNVDDLEDEDPRAQELMDKLQALWKEAPVVPELNGALVRLPGFVVPLETDGEKVGTFLLVPYYGACIHVPPPPANQTVYVVTEQGKEARQELFDTVWVTGTLQVEHTSSDVADAGYTLYAETVTPYEQ